MTEETVAVVESLTAGVDALHDLDLADVEPRALLSLMRGVEVLRRRLDSATDRLVDACDTTAAHVEDGHRSTKAAVKHLGRLPGGEAHGRVQTARALRCLPAVAAAYRAGRIPTASVRAIARAASNPRVAEFLPVADAVFAEQGAQQGFDGFRDWLRRWEGLADADGAAAGSERGHARRNVTVLRNDVDGTWHLAGDLGDLQGAVVAEVFEAFVAAELEADLAWARRVLGDDFSLDQLPRTAAQRRADALVEVFRRAAVPPTDARSPEPLVSIVIDQDSFENALARACGDPVVDDPARVDALVSHSITGAGLHPAAVLSAALVGHVRRVVVDAAGTVVDVGRRRRLFTGSARDAAFLRALLRDRGGTGCFHPGCDAPRRRLQVDHVQPFARGGSTDNANADLACGVHNRLKEHGFRPRRAPDGTWTVHRPDGTPITPAA